MKPRDRYLTGFLLLLIGILIGTLFTLYQNNTTVNGNTEVKFTEIKRSSGPDSLEWDLEEVDERFMFKSVAERTTPTVVYIETIVPVDRGSMPDDEFHEEDDEESFWDRFMPREARTVGSGVIITEDGYILTNNHVIDDAVDEGIRVILNDKRAFYAQVVGQDPTTDLAVIRIDADRLTPATVGDSDSVDVGEWVLAVGNPFRLRSTVTAGIVSALSRDVEIIRNSMRVESFIQTDAAINRGNSGGALVNTNGDLVGINTAIASQSGNYQGYGFAVPSNLAMKVASDIIEYGEVRRALLGVSIEAVDFDRAETLNMNSVRGVEVVEVHQGSAERAGVEARDVILSVNGTEVNEANKLQEKIALMKPGDVATLEIWRNGEIVEKDVELSLYEDSSFSFSGENNEGGGDRQEERNPEEGMDFQAFELGFDVMALSKPENSDRYDLIITEVEKQSEAWNRGVREGLFITEVEGSPVEDLTSLRELFEQNLDKKDAVLLTLQDKDDTRTYIELKR